MKVLYFLYFCYFFAPFSSLIGSASGPDAASRINACPTVKMKAFDYSTVRFTSHPIGIGDARVQFSNYKSTCYAFGDKIYTISNSKNEILERPIEIPERRAWDDRHQLKFRFGYWYFRIKDHIFKINPETKKSELFFAPKRNFSQFEISPTGKILLICSGLPQTAVNNWAYAEPFDYYIDSTLKFISIFDHASIEPEKELEIPNPVRDTIEVVGHIAGPSDSFWVSDTLVIHSCDLGRIWCFDFSNSKLNELPPFWASLDTKFVQENIKLARIANSIRKTIYIPRDTFPTRFVFFPVDFDTVYLIAKWDKITDSLINDYLEKGKSSPICGGMTKLETRNDQLKFYRIDLSKMKIELLEDQDYLREQLKRFKGHYLLDFDSTPIPWPIYSPPPPVGPR